MDAFLARKLGQSATQIRKLLRTAIVRLNGRRSSKGETVAMGATVQLIADVEDQTNAHLPSEESSASQSVFVVPDSTVTLPVVFVDDHLVAVNKPAGIPSHPLNIRERGTAANGIVAMYGECAVASEDPREGGLAHRLDTGTSGVLIAARSRDAWQSVRAALASAASEKTYLAEVLGHPPDNGRIDATIGRIGRRGRAVKIDGGRNPQSAETSWMVVSRGADTSLVMASLHRGRPHQVRAHLAASGFPIVGDDRYGSAAPGTDVLGLRLHAFRVKLPHPIDGTTLIIEAPPPPWAKSARFLA